MYNRLRDIDFEIQDYKDVFALQNSCLLTLNTQLFLLYFIDRVLGDRIKVFNLCLDSRFIQRVLAVSFNKYVSVVVGSELLVPIFRECQINQSKLFLVGLSNADVKVFSEKVCSDFPRLKYALDTSKISIQGEPENFDLFVDKLLGFDPDIVVLCVGSPKQEKLALLIRDFLIQKGKSFRFIVGLGSSLDVYIGKQSPAPIFLKSLSVEWIWRSLSSRRLFMRTIRSLRIFRFF